MRSKRTVHAVGGDTKGTAASKRTTFLGRRNGDQPAFESRPAQKRECTHRPARRCGVGIDTSRYGHYAAFLRDDLQPAADELQFAESAAGYALFRQRLQLITERLGPVHFVVRLDAAGQYADNLLHF